MSEIVFPFIQLLFYHKLRLETSGSLLNESKRPSCRPPLFCFTIKLYSILKLCQNLIIKHHIMRLTTVPCHDILLLIFGISMPNIVILSLEKEFCNAIQFCVA